MLLSPQNYLEELDPKENEFQEAYLRMHDSAPYDDLVVVGYENVPEYKELTERWGDLKFILHSLWPKKYLARIISLWAHS